MPNVPLSLNTTHRPLGWIGWLLWLLLLPACGDDPSPAALPLAADTTSTQAHTLLVLAETEGRLERFLEALEVVEIQGTAVRNGSQPCLSLPVLVPCRCGKDDGQEEACIDIDFLLMGLEKIGNLTG